MKQIIITILTLMPIYLLADENKTNLSDTNCTSVLIDTINSNQQCIDDGITSVEQSKTIQKSKTIITKNEHKKHFIRRKDLFSDIGAFLEASLDFFTMKDNRKHNGLLVVNKYGDIKPKTSITLQALATLEKQAIISVSDLVKPN